MSQKETTQWANVIGAEGRDILKRFLNGVTTANAELKAIIDAAISGDFDDDYAGNPSADVKVTTACHMMVLAIVNRLNGMNATDYYKSNPQNYVRLNCLIQRMLGIERLTLCWPVYGFGAEALGQTMIYTEDQAPGSDPGNPLLNKRNWQDMPVYEPDHTIARVVRENLQHMAQLAGIEPVAHLPAPYSLAAEIYGQEHLIIALIEEPEFVHQLLDLIVERVLVPWCADLHGTIPNVWLELSDASGSPMFIGPEKFLEFAADSVEKVIVNNAWGDRVFVANYRGDLPAGARTRGRRKRLPSAETQMSFERLLEAKIQCCPFYLTRLEMDNAPVNKYVNAAVQLKRPLYLGIGAVRLDRNSITDLQLGKQEIYETAKSRTIAICNVSKALEAAEMPRASQSWPGDIYIEDTNVNTHMDIFEAVLEGVRDGNSAV
ncbi:MAG: hypothetical protein JKY41_08045 [Rhodobacteraceae bacterium]|nr:hypothetical protein [Paracoccaceae bacterium]